MGRLLSQVVPLALGAAISPVLFVLTLTTLTGARPLVRGLALTAGAAVPLVVIGSVSFALRGAPGRPPSHTPKAALARALGVLPVLVAVRALAKGPAEPKPPDEPKHTAGPVRSFAL